MPTLEHCFTMRGYIDKNSNVDIKNTKGGPSHQIVPVFSGFLRGKGIDAEIIPGGGDYPLMDIESNTARLDVRLPLRTKNGHGMFIHYHGLLQLDEKCTGPLTFASDAQSTQFGDHEWFTSPIIETSDPEMKWVERSAFVGEGRFVVEDGIIGIEYEIYQVRPSR